MLILPQGITLICCRCLGELKISNYGEADVSSLSPPAKLWLRYRPTALPPVFESIVLQYCAALVSRLSNLANLIVLPNLPSLSQFEARFFMWTPVDPE